jgi:hypothetical protein
MFYGVVFRGIISRNPLKKQDLRNSTLKIALKT